MKVGCKQKHCRPADLSKLHPCCGCRDIIRSFGTMTSARITPNYCKKYATQPSRLHYVKISPEKGLDAVDMMILRLDLSLMNKGCYNDLLSAALVSESLQAGKIYFFDARQA